MKFVKTIALFTMLIGVYSVSELSAAPSSNQMASYVAGGCPTWPYCRDVEVEYSADSPSERTIKDQNFETRVIAGGCPTWPYCRDVEVAEETLNEFKHALLKMDRKAA